MFSEHMEWAEKPPALSRLRQPARMAEDVDFLFVDFKTN